jgi:hypothetical protein
MRKFTNLLQASPLLWSMINMKTLLVILLLLVSSPSFAAFNHHCYLAKTFRATEGVEYSTPDGSTVYGCHLNSNNPYGLFHLAAHGEKTDKNTLEIYEGYYDAGNGVNGWRIGRLPMYYGLYSENRVVRDTQDFMVYPPSIYRDNVWPTSQSIDGVSFYSSSEHVGYDHQHIYNLALGAPIGLRNRALALELTHNPDAQLSHAYGFSSGMRISGARDDFRVDAQYMSVKQDISQERKEFARLLAGGRRYMGNQFDLASEFMVIKVYDVGTTSSSWNVAARYQATPKWRIHAFYDINCNGLKVCSGGESFTNHTFSLYTDYVLNKHLKLQAQAVRGHGAPSFNTLYVTSAEPRWSVFMLGAVLNF